MIALSFFPVFYPALVYPQIFLPAFGIYLGPLF